MSVSSASSRYAKADLAENISCAEWGIRIVEQDIFATIPCERHGVKC